MFEETRKEMEAFDSNASRLQASCKLSLPELWYYRNQYKILLDRAKEGAWKLLQRSGEGISFDEADFQEVRKQVLALIQDYGQSDTLSKIIANGDIKGFYSMLHSFREQLKSIAIEHDGACDENADRFWEQVFQNRTHI